MSLDPIEPPAGPSAPFLQHLADVFAAAVHDLADGAIVMIPPTDGGHDVATVLLEGRAPADVLFGSVAPEGCWALGVVTHGWVRPLAEHGAVGPRRGRADVVVLVDRDGHVASRLDVDGDRVTERPAYGATLDCLQRAFELPTAPRTGPPGWPFAQQWLDQVCAVGRRRGTSLTWRQVADLHPARQLALTDDRLASVDLVEAAQALGRVCDWDRLRWLAVEGTWPCGLSGAEAAWLDAGSFSRWVLGRFPDLPALLDGVSAATGTATARRCARILRQLWLLTRGAWRPTAA